MAEDYLLNQWRLEIDACDPTLIFKLDCFLRFLQKVSAKPAFARAAEPLSGPSILEYAIQYTKETGGDEILTERALLAVSKHYPQLHMPGFGDEDIIMSRAEEIVDWLSKRVGIVEKILQRKAERGLSGYNPDRHQQVIDNGVKRALKIGANAMCMQDFITTVADHCRDRQVAQLAVMKGPEAPVPA